MFKKERRLIDFTLKMQKKEQGARNRAQGRKTKFQKTKANTGQHKEQGTRENSKKQGSISKGRKPGSGANFELKNDRTPNP
ncbi:hypothetical protein WG954_19035 [Lacibacter sp. H375]|uniref:hypothetical protein n=1 Tax=Lacibacter sp. H375 TaxID=3133424 RepID=UPI0030C2733A